MTNAPGKPGADPHWCSGDKDLVITSLGTSHTWVTLGHGILNETYWPSTGRPQIRDLGFIVAKDHRWWELAELGSYQISTPQPHIMLPTIQHHGEQFVVTLDVLCDDLRDTIVIRFKLDGDGHRLYVTMVPRLGSRAAGNSAWCEQGEFYAAGHGVFLSLRADVGFERRSAGYVGVSDGRHDFQRHSEMTWQYERAEDGNVSVTGELAANEGVLALSFATDQRGAETLARSSLAEGFPTIHGRVVDRWEEWRSNWNPPAQLPQACRNYVERSVAVLKTCEDRLFPGAVVASLSIPWGNSRDSLGGYHLVWARDSVESAMGMIAVGHYREARQLVAYLMATQQDDGHWTQNFYPSGRPYWTATQLDQTSFPVVLVAKLRELRELGGLTGVDQMVARAIRFLVKAGPVTPEDRWEENQGINAFTVGMVVAAIVGAAEHLHPANREYALSYADYLNRRIEDWLYVEDTDLSRKYGVAGHYIRLAPPIESGADFFAGQHGRIPIANRPNLTLPASEVVALDYMYLARLGLRRPDDPRMINTLKVVEGELRVETPSGPSFYRYTCDGYGEHEDGSPFNGTGVGRLWPLLTGERGHLAAQAGDDAQEYLDAMCRMTGPGGMLPEQIWDKSAIPDPRSGRGGLYPGKPTHSAMPLLWAQAELVKLAAASVTHKPIELLDAVERRYGFERPAPDLVGGRTWHWRSCAPFLEIPYGVDLLVEAPEPFRLHLGFDDWRAVDDRHADPLGLGMHGVRIHAEEMERHEQIVFTLFYDQRNEWAGHDYSVRLAAGPSPRLQRDQDASAVDGPRRDTPRRSVLSDSRSS